MQDASDPIVAARLFHDALPMRIREYLNHRGIRDAVIDAHLLGWDGRRITIPIFNREGQLSFFKRAKDPDDQTPGPKMLTPAGGSAELYGWERLRGEPPRIVICEGEFDRLVLEGQGIAAVTSTGGAGVFRRDWAGVFRSIPEVFICFDRDDAGRMGALRVASLIAHARLVELPEAVGEGGDVTDFFVRLGKAHDDFDALLALAAPASAVAETEQQLASRERDTRSRDRVERVKRDVPIVEVVRQYVPSLRGTARVMTGRCPFHDDQVPSLAVYADRGRFHCYGCGAHGDVIDFVMRVEHLTFLQALDTLDAVRLNHGPTAEGHR
jgi:DNA primase